MSEEKKKEILFFIPEAEQNFVHKHTSLDKSISFSSLFGCWRKKEREKRFTGYIFL